MPELLLAKATEIGTTDGQRFGERTCKRRSAMHLEVAPQHGPNGTNPCTYEASLLVIPRGKKSTS